MRWLAVVVLVGCSSHQSATRPQAPLENKSTPKPDPVVTHTAEFSVVAGEPPHDLGDGVTVDARDLVEIEVAKGEYLEHATLIVVRNGQRVELVMSRHRKPSGKDKFNIERAHGWRFELLGANPHGNPAQTYVFARKP